MAGTYQTPLSEKALLKTRADQELSSPPFDSVSQVRFSPTNPSHLLVSSWDTVSHIPASV